MRNVVAIMNTKGGVGKSTVAQCLAESLSVHHDKSILVIDADSQGSVSYLLVGPDHHTQLLEEKHTLVDLLDSRLSKGDHISWQEYITSNASDLDDAHNIHLLASDMELILFERDISKRKLESKLRRTIANLLAEMRSVFDVILIDCPPGLSVLTECWIREADFHILPTKPDYISSCGLAFFRNFRERDPNKGFSQNLGVLITMKEQNSLIDEEFHRWLAADEDNYCFDTVIPRSNMMKYAASFVTKGRSIQAKYPGEAGDAIRQLAVEFMQRIDLANAHESSKARSYFGL